MIDLAKNHEFDESEERFIPVTLNDLVSKLMVDLNLPSAEKLLFKRFCKIFIALYHAKFFATLQNMKEKSYSQFWCMTNLN